MPVNVRIVSATHRDLRAWAARGAFRGDLFYRLVVVELHVPPLRERREDLPVLTEHFLSTLWPHDGPPPRPTAEAWAALAAYPFPGNVRELKHCLHHALLMTDDRERVALGALPPHIARSSSAGPRADSGAAVPLADAVSAFERGYIEAALRRCDGQRLRAARLLGISRKTLWKKCRQYQHDSG